MAVHEAKKLTLVFDRWTGSDEELREWTLEKTSEMRESIEGQEGLFQPSWREGPLIGLRSSLRVVVMFPEWMEGANTILIRTCCQQGGDCSQGDNGC